MKGEVANNFHLPRVGYYHSAAPMFFEHPTSAAASPRAVTLPPITGNLSRFFPHRIEG